MSTRPAGDVRSRHAQRADEAFQRFAERYGRPADHVAREVEREVIGFAGANGYTTLDQAHILASMAGLGPGVRALDIGAGSGWPGVHLAQRTGCEMTLSDVPLSGLRSASQRMSEFADARCDFVAASAAAPPFRARSFDAILHTDVLC